MSKKFNDIFGNFDFFFNDFYTAKSYEVTTDEETVILSIVAPGHAKEDIDINLEGDQIHISTPNQETRKFKIPGSVSKKDILAEYDAGIVKIKFKKKKSTEKRKITIT